MSKHSPATSESLYALLRARARRTDTSVNGMNGLPTGVWVTLSDLGSYVSSKASVTDKTTHFQMGLAGDAVGLFELPRTLPMPMARWGGTAWYRVGSYEHAP